MQIGTITYSYRSMPDQSGDATLNYVVESGISAIALMSGPAEQFAGAPASGRVGGRRGQADAGGAGVAARGGRAVDAVAALRLDGHLQALRKKYHDAGVTIFAWKCLNPGMSDQEIEYVFNVAPALGCTHTTLELTDDVAQLKRIGGFAEKYKIQFSHQGPHHARPWREEPAVGHRPHAGRGDFSAGQDERVEDAGHDRTRVRRAARIRRGEGSAEVPGLLQDALA